MLESSPRVTPGQKGKLIQVRLKVIFILFLSGQTLKIGKQIIAVDPDYFRPTEVDLLIGDPTKSKTKLGWKPKYDLKSMISEMVKSDLQRVKRKKLLKKEGFIS